MIIIQEKNIEQIPILEIVQEENKDKIYTGDYVRTTTGERAIPFENFDKSKMTKVRGKVDIEEQKNGKANIIISEIPYQLNKASLIEKIANLTKEKKLTKDQVILIGDNLETDIKLGYDAKIETIMVCSGVHTEKDIEKLSDSLLEGSKNNDMVRAANVFKIYDSLEDVDCYNMKPQYLRKTEAERELENDKNK